MAKPARRDGTIETAVAKVFADQPSSRIGISTEDVFDVFPDGDVGHMAVEDIFVKNPVAMWLHEQRHGAVGMYTALHYSAADGWSGDYVLDMQNPKAIEIARQRDSGFLRATSVGMRTRFDGKWRPVGASLTEVSFCVLGKDAGAIVQMIDAPVEMMHAMAKLNRSSIEGLTPMPARRILSLAASLEAPRPVIIRGADMPEPTETPAEPDVKIEPDTNVETPEDEETTEPAAATEPSSPETLTAAEPTPASALPVKTDEGRLRLEALARPLVGDKVDVSACTEREMMVAAVSWEDPKAADMAPLALEEKFADLVARRHKAQAKMVDLRVPDPKALEEFEASRKDPSGNDRILQAREKYNERILGNHKRVVNEGATR